MLEYRVEPLPPVWPQKATLYPLRAPFKTVWSKTLQLLEREIRMLGGRNVRIQVKVWSDRDIRQDGQLRADARPGNAVIVLFDTNEGTLQFPCDTFTYWQDNVGAIARALEDLRRVDRYGVRKGAQYTGYKQIAATSTPTFTAEEAARQIIEASGSGLSPGDVLKDRGFALNLFRIARHRSHPDRAGGDVQRFTLVGEAGRVLARHFGVPEL